MREDRVVGREFIGAFLTYCSGPDTRLVASLTPYLRALAKPLTAIITSAEPVLQPRRPFLRRPLNPGLTARHSHRHEPLGLPLIMAATAAAHETRAGLPFRLRGFPRSSRNRLELSTRTKTTIRRSGNVWDFDTTSKVTPVKCIEVIETNIQQFG